ncbi:hypothetical protein EXIGLDRAFT_731559 [Exidia glandulosa HHB12029]|uniref:F-box domain-containing protein n=1 Tax=Exidia glandulosa HHB12029 TaxID=1314781 RepID=A0A165BU78_EXIGL|nr:hypothetical protein EXIGLDRAFT_731559 [Exidia glandulosa HHB12029]
MSDDSITLTASMLPTARDLQALRMASDEDTLQTLNHHVAQLQIAHDTLKPIFESAKAAYDGAVEELRVAIAQRDSFRQTVDEGRKTSMARRLPNLPVDILNNCFEQYCLETDPFSLAQRSALLDHQMAMAPFTIAAVCRRWRDVALELPSVWCYISLPDPTKGDPRSFDAYRAYVVTVLERSAFFPLAITIDWRTVSDIDSQSNCAAVINLLAANAARWGAMHLNMSSFGSWADLLRHPTPTLQVLHCDIPDRLVIDADVSLRFLPLTPKLKSLRMLWLPIFPTGPLSALVQVLSIHNIHYISHAWNLLSGSHGLRILILASAQEQALDFAPLPVSLPHLVNLTLGHVYISIISANPGCLICPKLTRLQCGCDSLVQLDRAFQDLGRGLTIVDLCDCTVTRDGIGQLELLKNVMTFTLTRCTILEGFWEAVLAGGDAVLPRLKSLTFDDVIIDAYRDGLRHFVRTRRAVTGQKIWRLQRITFSNSLHSDRKLPSWYLAEIEHTMRETEGQV